MTKDKMNMYDLIEHKFIQECFKEGMKANQAIGSINNLKIKSEFLREPTEYEYYILGVSRSAIQLLNICQDLDDCLIYLKTKPASTLFKRLGITKHRYIKYSLENIIIRSQSLYDRVLFLIDAVFHLGIPDSCISHRILSENIHIKMSPVKNDLKKIKQALKKYHFTRNEIIHQRSYDDNYLRLLEAYTILSQSDEKYSIYEKELADDLFFEKKNEFTNFINDIYPLIEGLFNNLLKEFHIMKNRLLQG